MSLNETPMKTFCVRQRLFGA